MKPTDKNNRFRRRLNRALLLFWLFVLAALIRACNQPSHAETWQLETEPPTPTAWMIDPMAGIVLEPVSEEETK